MLLLLNLNANTRLKLPSDCTYHKHQTCLRNTKFYKGGLIYHWKTIHCFVCEVSMCPLISFPTQCQQVIDVWVSFHLHIFIGRCDLGVTVAFASFSLCLSLFELLQMESTYYPKVSKCLQGSEVWSFNFKNCISMFIDYVCVYCPMKMITINVTALAIIILKVQWPWQSTGTYMNSKGDVKQFIQLQLVSLVGLRRLATSVFNLCLCV